MGKKLFLPVVILILFCTGCAGNISIPKQQPEIDTKEPEQAAAVTPNTGFADMAGTDLTAYQTLDAPEDKVLYREIAEILGCMQMECEISAWEEEQISRVFACVMADHPEFFLCRRIPDTGLPDQGRGSKNNFFRNLYTFCRRGRTESSADGPDCR